MKLFKSDRTVFIWRIVLVCVLFVFLLAACIFGRITVTCGAEFSRYLPHVKEADLFRFCLIASLVIAASQLLIYINDRKSVKGDVNGSTDEASAKDTNSIATDAEDACEVAVSENAVADAEVTENSARETEDAAESDVGINASSEKADEETVTSSADQGCKKQTASATSKIMGYISSSLSVLPFLCSIYVFYFAFSDESLGTWGNAIMASALFSALFFLFKIIKPARAFTLLCGFGVFVLGALVIASLYLDHLIEINSHFKLLVQFGAAGLIISTMADIRSILSRISSRWFITLKSIALILCSICPAVMLSLPAANAEIFPSSYFVYSALYLSCVIPLAFDTVSAVVCDRLR